MEYTEIKKWGWIYMKWIILEKITTNAENLYTTLASQTQHLQEQHKHNLWANLVFIPVFLFSANNPGHHNSICSHHLFTPFT